MKYFILLVGCLVALVGCKVERDPSSLFGPDASGVLVVDALLIVDKPLPRVLISETVKANAGYSERWEGVGDAEVVIISRVNRRFCTVQISPQVIICPLPMRRSFCQIQLIICACDHRVEKPQHRRLRPADWIFGRRCY